MNEQTTRSHVMGNLTTKLILICRGHSGGDSLVEEVASVCAGSSGGGSWVWGEGERGPWAEAGLRLRVQCVAGAT